MDMLEILNYGFIKRALLAGSLIAVLCAVLGIILVLRRLSMIGDGLSHVTFGSAALAMALNIYPLAVSLPVVVISSFGIQRMTEKSRIYGDAAIGVVSSVGIAAGVILASMSGGFNVDLFSYLFGSILSTSTTEVMVSLVVSLIALTVISVYLNEIFSITFDEEFARASGIPVDMINYILIVLTAVTVVLSMKIVGVMLTSALIVLPAVTALQNSNGFKKAMLTASLVSILCIVGGVITSFVWNLPAGAVVVLLNALFCAMAFIYKLFLGHN